MMASKILGGYSSEIAAEAERWLHHEHMPYDLWFSVASLIKRKNSELHDWAQEKARPGETLAALELLVASGYLEAGRDEFGARVFRRR